MRAHHVQRLARLALRLRLAQADQRRHARLDRRAGLGADLLVGLAPGVAALGVADDHEARAGLAEHGRRDLAGMGARGGGGECPGRRWRRGRPAGPARWISVAGGRDPDVDARIGPGRERPRSRPGRRRRRSSSSFRRRGGACGHSCTRDRRAKVAGRARGSSSAASGGVMWPIRASVPSLRAQVKGRAPSAARSPAKAPPGLQTERVLAIGGGEGPAVGADARGPHHAPRGDRAEMGEGVAYPVGIGAQRAESASSKRIDSPQPQASTTLGLRNSNPDSRSEVR